TNGTTTAFSNTPQALNDSYSFTEDSLLSRAFPIGHGCVDASGNALVTVRGVKFTDVFPTGSVTHPWLPRYFAVRVMPFGIVTWTALLMWSMAGLPTFARSR